MLAANGLDPDRDVDLIGLNERYPQVVDLFGSGDLDAAVLSEPNVSIGEDRGAFAVWQALTDAQFCPAMQWTVVVAGERTRTAEPELIRAALRASRRSYHWCNEHPDEWAAFIARRLGIPRATAARSIERERPDLHYDCRPDLAGLELAIELQPASVRSRSGSPSPRSPTCPFCRRRPHAPRPDPRRVIFLAAGAVAQEPYPSKALRIITPAAPGTSPDLLSRVIAQHLAPTPAAGAGGEPAGRGGNIGHGNVARATADGYTLLVTSDQLSINQTLFQKLPFHALDSFAPVVQAIVSPQVLIVSPKVQAKDVQGARRVRAGPTRARSTSARRRSEP